MTPLHHIGEAIRQLLLQIPLGAVRALFVLALAALLLWVLTLPRTQTTPPEATTANRPVRLSENLKLWAAASLALQIVIYLLL